MGTSLTLTVGLLGRDKSESLLKPENRVAKGILSSILFQPKLQRRPSQLQQLHPQLQQCPPSQMDRV